MKTTELIGPTLDWAVAKCEGYTLYSNAGKICCAKDGDEGFLTKYSTDWSQGGPLIERARIAIFTVGDGAVWEATQFWACAGIPIKQYGPTPLVAAMRCFVASKLGDEVEIPEELK